MLGQVYALNAKTGAQLWSFATGSSFDGTAVESSPAVANGVVYVAADDNNLYALDANTGAQLWSFAGIFVSSSPAVANGVVYIGSFSGLYANVYALNVTTGAQLWSFKPVGSIFNAPAVANGVVYVDTDNGNGGNLYALDAGTGAKLWSYANGDLWRSSPSIVDGVLYASSISSTSASATTLYAFSLGTGISADLFLRIIPSTMTVHQGDLITYAFPVWNLGPANADFEVLNTEVPAGTTLDYTRISGTPGLGTCTSPPYQGTGKIVCHENSAMAPNTTWTVRVVVKVTAPAGTVITANAATMSDTPDPNMANNMATVSVKVQ